MWKGQEDNRERRNRGKKQESKGHTVEGRKREKKGDKMTERKTGTEK